MLLVRENRIINLRQLTEEGEQGRPVLNGSQAVLALHKGLAEGPGTRAAPSVHGVNPVSVGGGCLAC